MHLKKPKLTTRFSGRITYEVPCSNAPKGKVEFILIVRPQDTYPERRCPTCGLMTALPGFLKGTSLPDSDGYVWWTDYEECYQCDDPGPLMLHFDDRGRLRMKVEMHCNDGSLYETWDDAEQRLRPPSEIGLRYLKDKGELRLQPYTKKSGPKAHRMDDHTGGKADVNEFGEKQPRLI